MLIGSEASSFVAELSLFRLQRREDLDEDAKFREAEENIKKISPKDDDVEKGAGESRSDQKDGKSKSCTIL